MTTQTPWYRTGTVAVTAGSKSVTGAGSAWQSQALAGDLFGLTDANGNLTTALAEVESVSSDTALTLKSQWPGSTLSGQKYAIIRNFTGSLPADLAARLSKLIAQYQISVDELTELLTSSGTVTLTTLTGETVSVQGMAGITTRLTAVESALAAKLDDSQATAAGLALLGAADVAAQRDTLGLANHNLVTVGTDGVVQVAGVQSGVESGQLRISPTGNMNAQLSMGFDGTNKYGFIQALIAGDNYYPLWLQKSAGRLLVGPVSADNGSDLLQVGGSINVTDKTTTRNNLELTNHQLIAVSETGVATANRFTGQTLDAKGSMVCGRLRSDDPTRVLFDAINAADSALVPFRLAASLYSFDGGRVTINTPDNGSDMLQVGGSGRVDGTLIAQNKLSIGNSVIAGTQASIQYFMSGVGSWNTGYRYSDGAFVIGNDGGGGLDTGARLTIDPSGNLIQTVNSTAATLSTNGTMTASIVNDTSLKFSVRGSDGVTRSATVALA